MGLVPLGGGGAVGVSGSPCGGLIGTWNRANPKHDVLQGDLIVAVNGMAGDAQAPRVCGMCSHADSGEPPPRGCGNVRQTGHSIVCLVDSYQVLTSPDIVVMKV